MSSEHLRILHIDHVPRATLAVANTAPFMGAAKLKTDRKGEACRVLSGTAVIEATWDDLVSLGVVVIPAHNGGPSSTIRVEGFLNVDDVEPLIDSGERWAAPGQMLANWDFTQPLNVNAFADNDTLSAVFLSEHVAVRRLRITLHDPDATFLDISKLVVGPYLETEYGASWGATTSIEDATENSRATSGDLRTKWGPKNRTLAFDLSWVVDADQARVRQIIDAGAGRWLFVSLMPEDEDPLVVQAYSIYGKVDKPASMAYQSYGLHSTQFQIRGY